MVVLLIVWLMFTLFLMSKNEKTLHFRQLAIPKGNDIKSEIIIHMTFETTLFTKSIFSAYILDEVPVDPRVGLIFRGSFYNEHYDNDSSNYMQYYLSMDYSSGRSENITPVYQFPVVNISEMDTVKEIKRSKTIPLDYKNYDQLVNNKSVLKLNMITNFNASFPVNFIYDPSPLDKDMGIIYATIVLLGLYIMIIWELVHRTFAAIIASTMSIGKFF